MRIISNARDSLVIKLSNRARQKHNTISVSRGIAITVKFVAFRLSDEFTTRRVVVCPSVVAQNACCATLIRIITRVSTPPRKSLKTQTVFSRVSPIFPTFGPKHFFDNAQNAIVIVLNRFFIRAYAECITNTDRFNNLYFLSFVAISPAGTVGAYEAFVRSSCAKCHKCFI